MISSIKRIGNNKKMSIKVTWFTGVMLLISFTPCFLFLPKAEAYLERAKTVYCPVCGEKTTIFETVSMTVSGSYRDFQRRINGPYYFHLFGFCRTCHYSRYVSEFSGTLTEETKYKILTELKPMPVEPFSINIFEFAAKIYLWEKRNNAAIAQIYLFGSYYLKYRADLKDNKSVDLRKKYQALAGECFINALEANEIKEKDRGVISYLIGELYRRQGKFEKAIYWYDIAFKEKSPDEFRETILKQKEMALNRDADNDI